MELGRSLRIAYLADPHESLAREWMGSFANFGHDVTLIVRHGTSVDDGLDPRISIRRMPESPRRGPGLAIVSARRAAAAILQEIQPDILHVHDLTTGFGWIAWLSGFHPYVVTTWGSDIYHRPQRSRRSRLASRLTLSGADLITTESRDLANAAIRAGARAGRIRLVQFGVETGQFRPAQPDPALRARLQLDGRRVLFSPRQIAPLYDHLSVVRAAAGLPTDVVVLMSARHAHPDYLREVEEAALLCGLGERLVIVPNIAHDDMASFYSLADVVVSVPHSDSISVSVLEALACGRPVVASDLASPKEWLDEVSPDLLVPAGDPAALHRALTRALSLTDDELERMATLSRRIVIERAERAANMRRMETLYRSLVSRSR